MNGGRTEGNRWSGRFWESKDLFRPRFAVGFQRIFWSTTMDSLAALRPSDPTASPRPGIGSPVGFAVRIHPGERRENPRFSKGAATVHYRSRYPFVGGSDPGFGRPTPPKTRSLVSFVSGVAPAHGVEATPGKVSGSRRTK